MLSRTRYNLLLSIGIGLFIAIVVVFVGALTEAHAGEIATALATVIGGAFVLVAAIVAWKGVQAQAQLQRSIEAGKRGTERLELESALTPELMVFSRSIIDATSMWNARAHDDREGSPQNYPKLLSPTVYPAIISRIGQLAEGWPAMAVITFFGNVLELNEIADESLRGRPTTGQNNAAIARRFQMMALNLEQALDGLNADRKFPLTEVDLGRLTAPGGTRVGAMDTRPTDLQSLLAVLGGRNASKGGAENATP